MKRSLIPALLLFFSINASSQKVYSKFTIPTGNYDVDFNPALCVFCSVSNASRVADNDLSNYAAITMPAGTLTTLTIRATLNGTAVGGTYAGFYLGASTLTGVLPKVTVKVFMNGSDEQTIVNDADFLSLLSGGSGDLGAITPAGHTYNEVEITFEGIVGGVLFNTNAYYAFGGSSTLLTSTLPVKFSEMGYVPKDDGNEITWVAESDGSATYEIQRSADGINFTTIGKIASSDNNGDKYFNFYDPEHTNSNFFYRIRATEENSSRSYFSKTISVNKRMSAEEQSVSIFPNPVTERNFSIRLPANSKRVRSVDILDTKGLVLFEEIAPVVNNGRIQIQLKNTLKPGLYIVRVKSDNLSDVASGKLIIK